MPAKSKAQQRYEKRFAGAELKRKRAGKKTKTEMTEKKFNSLPEYEG